MTSSSKLSAQQQSSWGHSTLTHRITGSQPSQKRRQASIIPRMLALPASQLLDEHSSFWGTIDIMWFYSSAFRYNFFLLVNFFWQGEDSATDEFFQITSPISLTRCDFAIMRQITHATLNLDQFRQIPLGAAASLSRLLLILRQIVGHPIPSHPSPPFR